MTIIKLRAKGYLTTMRNFKRFNIGVSKETPRLMRKIASFIQKSAKLRAPRASGYLAENITARAISKNKVIVRSGAYYSAYQEYGFTPHVVSLYLHPELANWARLKNYPIMGVFKVRKFKPFMKPAVEEARKRIPLFIKQMMNKLKGTQSRSLI